MKEPANIFGSFLSSLNDSSKSESALPSKQFSNNISNLIGSAKNSISGIPSKLARSYEENRTDPVKTILTLALKSESPQNIADFFNSADVNVDTLIDGIKTALDMKLLSERSRSDGSPEYVLTPIGKELAKSIK